MPAVGGYRGSAIPRGSVFSTGNIMCLGLLTHVLGKHSAENYYDLPKITTLPHLGSPILFSLIVKRGNRCKSFTTCDWNTASHVWGPWTSLRRSIYTTGAEYPGPFQGLHPADASRGVRCGRSPGLPRSRALLNTPRNPLGKWERWLPMACLIR